MPDRRQSAVSNPDPVIAGVLDGRRAFSGPEQVVFDLTNRCNLDCIGCWTRSPLLGGQAPEPDWHRQELDGQRALELIGELSDLGVQRIRFTGGGEPFMHPRIFDLIRAVKEKGLFCAVTTNLTLLGERQAEELASLGLDEVAASVWAATPETYLKTHPSSRGGTFERITQALQRLAVPKSGGLGRFWGRTREKRRVNILNVICNLNCHQIEAMFDYALAVGADSIYYTVIDTVPGATESLLLSDEQRAEALAALDRVGRRAARLPKRKRTELDNFEGFRKRLASGAADLGLYDQAAVEEIPCYIGWLFCRIMANGDVAPCCRGVNIPMGNLYQRPFAEIWHSKKYNWFRHKARDCSKSERYFSTVGCQKTCDNLMHNLEMHRRLGRALDRG